GRALYAARLLASLHRLPIPTTTHPVRPVHLTRDSVLPREPQFIPSTPKVEAGFPARHPRRPACRYSETPPPEGIWPMRKMTNSAGFTGARPISTISWPASTTSGGLVSASHLTKKAFSAVSPMSAPFRWRSVRNELIVRVTRFHRRWSLGSKTTHWV